MRVLDASVLVDALASAGEAGLLARRLLEQEGWLHLPAIAGVEVTSALRAMLHRGELDAGVARQAAVQAGQLRTRHYPFVPFLPRVWDLRGSVTPYDAWYVALAEELDASLVTADRRLQRAAGPRCPVVSPQEALTQTPL